MSSSWLVVVVAAFATWVSVCGLNDDITRNEPRGDKCGDDLKWSLESGVLTISGTGAMTDFNSSSDAPWSGDGPGIETVIIDDGVTTIGNYAFADCIDIKTINVGASLTSVGDYAFAWCSFLDDIQWNASVETIGEFAFYLCDKLNESAIHRILKGVETIGTDAFSYTGIKQLDIPDSVKSIGNSAFESCMHLEAVNISSSVEFIGDNPFRGCTYLAEINVSAENSHYIDK